MNINWFPGHMKKTLDMIKENLKLVDLCCEIVDARIPYSSSNPKLRSIIGNKPLLTILNKADLADPVATKHWIDKLKSDNNRAIAYNSQEDRKISKILNISEQLIVEKRIREREKNITNSQIRMMIIGIPNSGKSTFINNISKRKGTVTGNKPGVTKSKQWIKTDFGLMLLDTPGVLWPKLDGEVGQHLAYTGAIPDHILEIENLSFNLANELLKSYSTLIENRYGYSGDDALGLLNHIAKKSGAIRNNEVDYFRVAGILLDDFRKNRIGRITLEK